MKRLIISLLLMQIFMFGAFSQSTWHNINSEISKEFSPRLISSNISETIIEFKIGGFYLNNTDAPILNSKSISLDGSGRMLLKGKPDLVQLTSSIIIPDNANMQVEVDKSEFIEIHNIEIAPSKGNFSRSINPSTVPYEYSSVYNQNAWFPGKLAELSNPFILRDFRGTTVVTYPFQYNPVTKVLRVYHTLVVKITQINSNLQVINPHPRTKAITSFSEDFKHIYNDRFLNFNLNKYSAPIERGRILVISHGAFIEEMMPYVRWKNQIGFPTEIVNVSTIGNNALAIKNFVTNYYNTQGLTFLLLVGDEPQVVTNNLGAAPGGLGTMFSDNFYGAILGNDDYYEVMVGRFSATTTNHVATQVRRTIEYERGILSGTHWLPIGMGVAANEGAGNGHNGEADYQHMDIIRTVLLGYTYDDVHREYDQNVPGLTNTTSTIISNKINAGVSIINYINHGSETSWSVANYSNTHINALTNVGRLPFIWSVACLNGKFTHTTDCMGEAWLKATHNTTGEPTGALASYMSTINQPWVPPMDAQDEFNNVLVESYENKIRRTYGAISASGTMHMLDLGPSDNVRQATAKTWTIFGDPSVMVRTDVPTNITANYLNILSNGQTNLTVNSNTNGAFVTLSKNFQIIATGTINGGSASLTFNPVFTNDTLTITLTAFNTIPYIGQLTVLTPTLPYDILAVNLIEPKSSYNCIGVNINPKFVIRNIGINTVNSLNIYFKLNNSPEQSITWTGNLPSLGIDTINLPAFTLTAGNNTFTVRSSNPNSSIDGNLLNDTAKVNFTAQNLNIFADFVADNMEFCKQPATVKFTNLSENAYSYHWNFGDGNTSTLVNPTHNYQNLGSYNVTLTAFAGVCGTFTKTFNNLITVGALAPTAQSMQSCGPDSVSLFATANGPIYWFSDPQGTNLIHTGTSFTTPYISTSQTYYLRTEMENISFGGKTDSSGTGAFFTSNTAHGLIFNAYEPVLLKSVLMYAQTAGNRVIRLENSAGTLIQSVTVFVPAGASRVNLNLNIPVGNDLRLMGPLAPGLFRNGSTSSPTLPYPYSIGSFIDITSSTASSFTQQFYYYFYDWEVVRNCKSALVPIHAYIVSQTDADFNYNINNSTVSFNNISSGQFFYSHWDFGDGNYSTDNNPEHTFANNGVYEIKLVVTNACGTDSISKQVNITTQIDENKNNHFVKLIPNPASDFSKVVSNKEILLLEIYDINGKNILNLKPNSKEVVVDISDLSKNVYFVKLTFENTVEIRKLIVK